MKRMVYVKLSVKLRRRPFHEENWGHFTLSRIYKLLYSEGHLPLQKEALFVITHQVHSDITYISVVSNLSTRSILHPMSIMKSDAQSPLKYASDLGSDPIGCPNPHIAE